MSFERHLQRRQSKTRRSPSSVYIRHNDIFPRHIFRRCRECFYKQCHKDAAWYEMRVDIYRLIVMM